MGRVDASLLKTGYPQFYDELLLDVPRVPKFIHCTKMFKLLASGKIEVFFTKGFIIASFCSSISPAEFFLAFLCSGLPAQVTIMERICAQWPALVSHVGFLHSNLPTFFIKRECGRKAPHTGWDFFVLKPNSPSVTVNGCELYCGLLVTPQSL